MEWGISLISGILGGGVVAAAVSVLMGKWSEKESRLFKAKLEAYTEFSAYLQNGFVKVANSSPLSLPTLRELGAMCLLVSGERLHNELKDYLSFVHDLYGRSLEEGFDIEAEKEAFQAIWDRADVIVGMMRDELNVRF